MVWVHGPTSMVWVLQKLVMKTLAPSVGVNWMWTKKNDHASKNEHVDFFSRCPKRAILKKNQVWPFSCLHLGFTCLPFLLNVSKMWLANLLTKTFTKSSWFNLYLFNVIYMWHVSLCCHYHKAMRKRTMIVFLLRCFWPPWNAVFKQLQFFLFPRRVIYLWKVIFKTFPTVYYKPAVWNSSIGRPKKNIALKFLSSRCPTLFGETCGSWFKG